MLGILSLWRLQAEFYVVGLESLDDHLNWVNSAVKLWEAPLDISVKLSVATTMRRVSSSAFYLPEDDPAAAMMLMVVKTSL